jgi:hypothetical protein
VAGLRARAKITIDDAAVAAAAGAP